MAISTKRVQVDSTGHWKQADWSEPWTDIWLAWKDRRRPRRASPCVMSKSHLEQEIDICNRIIAGNSDEETRQYFRDDLKQYQDIKSRLTEGEVLFTDAGLTEIWVGVETLDRKSIEKAVRLYFSKFVSNRPIRIKWKKPIGIVHGF